MEISIESINKDIETLLRTKIQEFINTDIKSIDLPRYGTGLISSILAEFGFEDNDEYDTNGWQVDFWYGFKHPIKGECTLSGDLDCNKKFTLSIK